MTRLLRRAQSLPGAPAVGWRDRRRLAKKRARAIEYSRGSDKKRRLCGELIAAARASRGELQTLAAELAEISGTAGERWRAQVDHYLPLIAGLPLPNVHGEIGPAQRGDNSRAQCRGEAVSQWMSVDEVYSHCQYRPRWSQRWGCDSSPRAPDDQRTNGAG
jgi:hypothetical protein